jgi:hypothetical protein
MDELFINNTLTKSLSPINSDERFFEGYLTVEVKDKQGEITIVDELYKVLPVWMDRGAPISDTHSNRIIGKGINFSRTLYKSADGTEIPAIKITGKIHKNYELDNEIWNKIKSGEYKGLSFGGATKANRTPKVLKDGSVAYQLTDLEHYEVAVCKDPAVPLALITDYNPLAKATVPSEPRGDGKEIIKCDKFGCYVDKEITDKDVEWFKSQNQGESVKYPNTKRNNTDREQKHHVVGGADDYKGSGEIVEKVQHTSVDFSNAGGDSPNAQSTQTIDSGGMGKNAKPVKMPELDSINTLEEVTELEGGIKDNKPTLVKGDAPFTAATGGGLRPAPDANQSNQDDPDKQTAQNTTTITPINQAVAAVLGRVGQALAEGAAGFVEGAARETGSEVKQEVEEKLASYSQLLEIKEKLLQKKEELDKSGYQTEDHNEKLGGQAEPEDAINQVNRE